MHLPGMEHPGADALFQFQIDEPKPILVKEDTFAFLFEKKAISASSFISEKPNDESCKKKAVSVAIKGFYYTLNKSKFLICQTSIDGTLLKVVLESIKWRNFHSWHYTVLCRHLYLHICTTRLTANTTCSIGPNMFMV